MCHKLQPEPILNWLMGDKTMYKQTSLVSFPLTIRSTCKQPRGLQSQWTTELRTKIRILCMCVKTWHVGLSFYYEVRVNILILFYRLRDKVGVKITFPTMHHSSPQSILGQRRRRRRRFHRGSVWLCNEICLPTLTKFDIEKVSFGRFVAKLTILVRFSCFRLQTETIWHRRLRVVVFNVMAAAAAAKKKKCLTPCRELPDHFVAIDCVNP